MRRFVMMISVSALALAAGACAKKPACDELAERLCTAAPAHCVAARAWIDERSTGTPDARDTDCRRVLDNPAALSASVALFDAAMKPSPASPKAAAPTAPGSTASEPARKPTTKDQVREVGATIEEIGKAGEKAGEAIDKIEDAFKRGDTK